MKMKAKRFPMDHPVRRLFIEHAYVEPYPKGVVAVPEQIPGTSFFPGGSGLWCEESPEMPPFPVGGVMVLGHDYHNVEGYNWSRQNVGENLRTSTWRHLLDLLKRVPIPLERCFFTNIYMGLREGDATTGRFPGSRDADFVARCQHFLIRQIQVQRPRLILSLGNYVPRFLAPLSPQLSAWSHIHTLTTIDSIGLALMPDVSFADVQGHTCTIACLIHPSYRPPNIGRRIWKNWTGDCAELEILRHAMSLASII